MFLFVILHLPPFLILHRVVCSIIGGKSEGGLTMKLAIMIEGSIGLTWERWKRLVSEVERMGFVGLFRSDHFTMPDPPDSVSKPASP